MIIKFTPPLSAVKAVSSAKIVVLCNRKEKERTDGCSELYALHSSGCTVMSTKLRVIYRNYN